MADVQMRDGYTWLCKAREGTFNTASTTNTDYSIVVANQIAYTLPDAAHVTNDGQMGRGHTYATKICQYNWEHSGLAIQNPVESFDDHMGRLMLRFFGGTITVTEPVTNVVFKHAVVPLPAASGHQLEGTSWIQLLGSSSFLFHGGSVEDFGLSWDGGNQPSFSATIVGTGKFTQPHGISSLPTTGPTQVCVNGMDSKFIWTDAAASTTDWSSTGRCVGFNVNLKNNHKLNDRRQGDGTSGPSGGTLQYAGRLLRGNMTAEASVRLVMNSADIAEWTNRAKNETYTDVTFTVQGPVLSGSTRAAISIVLPKCKLGQGMQITGENDGIAIVEIPIMPFYDSTAGGIATGSITNSTETNYE